MLAQPPTPKDCNSERAQRRKQRNRDHGGVAGTSLANNVWVVHQDSIMGCLAPDPPRKKLTAERVERAGKALKMLKGSSADVFRRPSEQKAVGFVPSSDAR